MKALAINPWFIETPKDQREILNDLIKNLNCCLEELTMSPQSNVAIYIILGKYGPTDSNLKLDKPTPPKTIIDELKNSFIDAGWLSVEEFHYNGHSLCFEIINQFIPDRPLLHFYLIEQDSKGVIKPPRKIKGTPQPTRPKNIEEIPEKFIG